MDICLKYDIRKVVSPYYKFLNFQGRTKIFKKDSCVLVLTYTSLANIIIVDFMCYALMCFRLQPIPPVKLPHFCMLVQNWARDWARDQCHANLWPTIFYSFVFRKFISFLCRICPILIGYKITYTMNMIQQNNIS